MSTNDNDIVIKDSSGIPCSSGSFKPIKVINDRNIFLIGKYKGKSVEDVIAFDTSYIGWLRDKPWAYSNQTLMALIKDVEVGDLTWGKYRGKTLEWIMINDESYMKFLYNSDFVRTRCPELKAKIDKIYI